MRKLIIAAVAAASVLATPAMARQSHVTSRHLAADAYASVVPGARYVGWRGCYPAPRVGAFATAPWTNDMLQLYAFDMLALDGEDLRGLPLSLRKTKPGAVAARSA